LGLEPHRTKLGLGLVLGTLTLCAMFLAQGSTRLLAGSLLPGVPTASAAVAAGPIQPAPGSTPPDMKAILARNMFDSQTGSLWPPKQPELAEGAEGDEEDGEIETLAEGQMPPACEGQLKMIGSVYSPSHPEWSIAVLGGATGAPLLYRVGGNLENKVVNAIYPNAVFLQDGPRLCSLMIFGEAPAAGKAPAPAAAGEAAPPAVPGEAMASDEYEKNITKISETQYTIKRALVDKVLANQAELMRSARIVPHEQDGKVVGVKLYGIRRKSLLGSLGLQNGDLLRTINGFDMSSPDTALEAYSKLRSANNLTMAVTRRGRATNLEYGISE
jgi:general secretion pathway protein C